jgi:hypothetical protein
LAVPGQLECSADREYALGGGSVSIEIFTYIRSKSPVERGPIERALATVGWCVQLRGDRGGPPEDGPVSGGLVVGWPRVSGSGAAIATALEAGHSSELQELYDREEFGSAEYFLCSPYSLDDEFGDDGLAELAGQVEARPLKEMKAARQRLELRTTAGRSDISVRLQYAVAVAVAAVYGGLFDDPQTDEWRVFAAGEDLPDDIRE